MRVLVTGAGGFVGAHVDRELRRAGHEPVDVVVGADRPYGLRALRQRADALVHLSPVQVRDALDAAWQAGARVVALLSCIGADRAARRAELSARGAAEEVVRAGGLPYVILRPEILWGPGDVFSNEIAHLLRHLPFVPAPRGGAVLAPVHAGDVARALVRVLERAELHGQVWHLGGPEVLSYAEVIERVARAIGRGHRRRLSVPAWVVRRGVALEERLDRRPRVTRALLDRLVADEHLPAPGSTLQAWIATTRMTVEALAEYLSVATLGAQLGHAATR